jgi:DNA-binding NarL/FixJ family response regulator
MANSDVTRSDEGPHSLTGKLIYIVGPGKLQNELMAFYLEDQTGAKGLTGDDLRAVLRIDDDHTDQPYLVLLDCQGKDPERLLAELESYGHELLSRIFVALFNVGPGLGIEEEAVRRGVRGFFYEQDPLDRFPKGVGAIVDGELWVSREIMFKCIVQHKRQDSLPRRNTTGLTPREMEILAMVAVGAKNEEIAEKLCISPHTVKTHIYNIFKKIGVPNRLQAALWAAKNL